MIEKYSHIPKHIPNEDKSNYWGLAEKKEVIALFIPGKALESRNNTFPGASLEDKLRLAIRRFLSTESFTDGEIEESTPKLIINKFYFSQIEMGYNVIARII